MGQVARVHAVHDHAPRLAPPRAPRVAQRRERDPQFGGPGRVADRGARLPGEVGRQVVGIVAERELRLVEHAVRLGATWRDAEDRGDPAFAPRVEHQRDVVVARPDVVAVGIGGAHAAGGRALWPLAPRTGAGPGLASNARTRRSSVQGAAMVAPMTAPRAPRVAARMISTRWPQ